MRSIRGVLAGRQDAGLGKWRQDHQALGRGQRPRTAHPHGHTERLAPWLSRRTERCWPREAMTRPSSSGTWQRAEVRTLSGHTVGSNPWRFAGRQDAGLGKRRQNHQALGRGQRTRTAHPQGAYDTVDSVAFSPDGKMLASGSETRRSSSGTWPAGANCAPSRGIRMCRSVAFSPDGKMLARAVATRRSSSGTWPAGAELRTLTGTCDRLLRGVLAGRQDAGVGQRATRPSSSGTWPADANCAP